MTASSQDKICRNCLNAYIGDSKVEKEMARQGYRSCRAAKTPVERARYVSGVTVCVYSDRFMAKEIE